jgi:hypothetical protein
VVASTGTDPATLDVETAREELTQLFETADTNSDGQLSYEEAVAVLPELTTPLFNELDADQDGQLSPGELEADKGCGCSGCSGCQRTKSLGDLGDLLLAGLCLLTLQVMAGRRM